MGRPTALNDDVQAKVVEALTVGSTYKHAAQYAGVTYDTFNNWMKRGGKAKSGKYFEFFNAVKKAEAECLARNLLIINKSAQGGTWQAAAWIAERRFPEDYGRQRHEHTGKDGAPIEVATMSAKELGDLMQKRYEAAMNGETPPPNPSNE